jgi:hypothetical protein
MRMVGLWRSDILSVLGLASTVMHGISLLCMGWAFYDQRKLSRAGIARQFHDVVRVLNLSEALEVWWKFIAFDRLAAKASKSKQASRPVSSFTAQLLSNAPFRNDACAIRI